MIEFLEVESITDNQWQHLFFSTRLQGMSGTTIGVWAEALWSNAGA